ncbi:MAG: hypothetical protein ACXWN2_06010 [Candidatus Limnocylindrales bacterium]
MLPPEDADARPIPPNAPDPEGAAPDAADASTIEMASGDTGASPSPEPVEDEVTPGLSGPSWRARYLPAFLSALIPGLGQLVRGRRALALLFLAPVIALGVLALYVALTMSPAQLVAVLVDPTVIWVVIALQVGLLIWRLAAAGQSLFDSRLPRPGRRDALPIALLMLLIVVPQVYAGYVTNVARETLDQTFDQTTAGAWTPSGLPIEPDPSDFETASPQPSLSLSPTSTPRLNVLLIGVDAGIGRNTYLTDTMIVASLDPVSETVSMVSIPRDMVDVPLPTGASSSPRSTACWPTHATIRNSSPARTGRATTCSWGRSGPS